MSPTSTEQGPEVLQLVHHHPGRLRLRSPAFVDNDAVATRVREALAGTLGVSRVDHDAHTGSLVVEYEPGLSSPDAIIERAAQAAGLLRAPDRPEGSVRCQGDRVVGACRRINAATYDLSGSRVELRTLVPFALAGLSAVILVVRGPRLPRWDNLAYWSISLFALLHSREMNAAPPASADGGAKAPR